MTYFFCVAVVLVMALALCSCFFGIIDAMVNA